MKVLIVDKMHASLSGLLAAIGLESDYRPEINREALLEIVGQYTGLIIRSKTPVDAELLQKAKNLRFVARAGSGLDAIDAKQAESQGIRVFNAPEANRDAVAEHTMGMLLGLLHSIHLGNTQIKNHIWNREDNRGVELKGKTVAVIGYGNIGKEVAKRLSVFETRVLVYDKYKVSYGDQYAEEATMKHIYEEADIVTLHIPLTVYNRFMVNEVYLRSFKKSILLINTARGKLVDLTALCKALESGKVIGACLDVLENENLAQFTPSQKEAFNFLIKHPQVILTPHVAGWTHESYERINHVLVEKIKQCLFD
ncbi:MAG: NAD(P)-dependent oxidoreductase [Microscillaceae bacterium]|nr:NAD(P)-dependent oxidoreductase [Microscillaceae bacterium]